MSGTGSIQAVSGSGVPRAESAVDDGERSMGRARRAAFESIVRTPGAEQRLLDGVLPSKAEPSIR
jgi:hypothetical protein